MFALCSSLAPRLAAKFGMEKLMALVLLVMVLGSGMRVLNLPALYIGTMLVGLQLRLLMFCYQVWLRLIFQRKLVCIRRFISLSWGGSNSCIHDCCSNCIL